MWSGQLQLLLLLLSSTMYWMPVDPMTANLQHDYFNLSTSSMSTHGLARICVYEGIFLATLEQSRHQVHMQQCSPVFIGFAHAMLCLALICHVSCIDQNNELTARSSLLTLHSLG